MTSISAQGSVLSFEADGLGAVTFNDASSFGAPIDFGQIDPIQYGFDLNDEMMIWHRHVTPMFTVSMIPGSPSDRKLRAFLLSALVADKRIASSDSVRIQSACYSAGPNHFFTFKDGYLVGGGAALGVSDDGRLTSAPYRFVFKSVQSGNGGSSGGGQQIVSTDICVNGSPISGLYYANVQGSTTARMISHPIETGALVFDQKYVEPEKVNVKVKVPADKADSIVSEFFDMLKDREVNDGKTSYSVSTKTEDYENLMLIGISHSETPDAYDLIDYDLTFQELLFSSSFGSRTASDAGNGSDGGSRAKGMQSTRPT